MINKKYLAWFKDVGKDEGSLVGGKGANLGEITQAGFPVPNGFIVTSQAYYYFIAENNLQLKIKQVLQTTNVHDPRQLTEASQRIKSIVLKGDVPQDLAKEIISYYEKLSGLKHCLVAVRSSATAEDLPDASFAGQQETYLNIKGEANLINTVRQCWASLFTPRAIFYREEKKFDHFKVGIAVPVQKMIQSESSGVMFTINPVTNDKKKIIIEAIWGLGEMIVQGQVTPDHYQVQKDNFKIVKKQVNTQDVQLIKSGTVTKEVKVKTSLQSKQKIADKYIIQLAKLGKRLQQHYFFPQDIEWALENGKLYILQTRPITTIEKIKESQKQKEVKIDLPLLCKGDGASPGIVSGYAKVLTSVKQLSRILKGDILVAEMTTPDFVPAMKKAAAIVTDKGGQTSHAAIVSRELGVPCIVGAEEATKVIKNNMVITVNATTGQVFKGGIDKASKTAIAEANILKQEAQALQKNLKTATKVYVNLGEPELASEIAKRNVDGVGLLRAEFMISQTIGVHPKKLIKDKKQKVFVDKLTEGLKTFCEAFANKPVVYRATDFKTNEYKNLKGGAQFEEEEANPMIGFRGAYRYIKDEQVFELELEAIKNVRNKHGLKNLWLMIPFVRRVEDLKEVKKIVASSGLVRSPSFHLWMMVEIPSNVILLDEFINLGIDGVSIGTNDLTMLLLGVDRDNEKVSSEFNELDPAVLWALEKIITTCHKQKITCSVCGQAPSLYPQLTKKLVDWGITSVSVTPDMIEKTREVVYQAETSLVKEKRK